MQWLRVVILVSLVAKLGVLGVWWTTPVQAESAAAEPAPTAETEAPAPPIPADLMERSRGFREVLTAVGERNAQLDAREQTLASREAGLAALEKAVAEQVKRLEALSGTPDAGARPARGPSAPGAKPTTAKAEPGAAPEIVRVYESMKAEEAAPILDKLDDDTLRLVLGRMKERQVGAILAAMNRERAVAFTKLLASDGGRRTP